MQQIIIGENEAGQRLDKFLHRHLKEAPNSLLFKMMRKKNITLNGKKANGAEKLQAGDSVELFFADETYAKFLGNCISEDSAEAKLIEDGKQAFRRFGNITVLYENDHVVFVDKPAGILSQKSKPDDLSLNEWLIGYLTQKGVADRKSLAAFRPSVCNRLDRNTSGVVICGKTLYGSQVMSSMLKDRSLHKYYRLYVEGHMEKDQRIEGYLKKDTKTNTVTVYTEEQPDSARIVTQYRPIAWQERDKTTLVEVELITGKTHQIRAHLSSIGYPLVGDSKYGDPVLNRKRLKEYGIRYQLLHAYRLVFPKIGGKLSDLSEKVILSPLPEVFGQLR